MWTTPGGYLQVKVSNGVISVPIDLGINIDIDRFDCSWCS